MTMLESSICVYGVPLDAMPRDISRGAWVEASPLEFARRPGSQPGLGKYYSDLSIGCCCGSVVILPCRGASGDVPVSRLGGPERAPDLSDQTRTKTVTQPVQEVSALSLALFNIIISNFFNFFKPCHDHYQLRQFHLCLFHLVAFSMGEFQRVTRLMSRTRARNLR